MTQAASGVRVDDLAAQARRIAEDVNTVEPVGEIGSLSLAVMLLSEAIRKLADGTEAA